MSELVCNYATARFLPYPETGEFVNVGVVVYCPEIGYFDFQLKGGRNRRVRQFFPELNAEVWKKAIESLKKHLTTCRNAGELLTRGTSHSARQTRDGLAAFQHLVRTRESLLHFAEPGVIVAVEPQTALNELFARLVEREFAQGKNYQEVVMFKRLAELLKEWRLKRLYRTNVRVGDADFHITLPFVHLEDERPIKAIKPLDLDKVETTEVYKHGDSWVQTMRRLKLRDRLPVETVFALRLPPAGKQLEAANEICEALKALNVDVVAFDQTARLHELAEVKRRIV